MGLALIAFVALSAVGLAVGRLVVGARPPADLQLLQWIDAARSPALTAVQQGLTFLGSTFWLVCVVLLGAVWLLSRRRPADAALLVAAGLGSTAITNLVKVLVARQRPDVIHLTDVSSLSFPSGHACLSAAVYLALALVLAGQPEHRRVAIGAAALLAMAVAYSRIYLGVHYPSDVVAGLALGWLWVTVLGALRRRGGHT